MTTVKILVDNKEIESIDLYDGNHKGEWISHYDEGAKEGWYECSCCHSERAFNTNFCPDCGADMRGKSCNACKNSDEEFSGECYECVKNIQNHYEPKESEE